MPNPHLPRDTLRRAPIVARDHPHFDAHRIQTPNSARGLRLHRVGDADRAGQPIANPDCDSSHSLLRQPLRLRELTRIAQAAHSHRKAVDARLHAVSGNRAKARRFAKRNRQGPRPLHDGPPQRMLGITFGRRRNPQHFDSEYPFSGTISATRG